MSLKSCWAAAAALAVVACAPERDSPPAETLVDETLTSSSAADAGPSRREVVTGRDSVVVALVDERLADLKVRLEATDARGGPLATVEVENHGGGGSLEVAALRVPAGARVTALLAAAEAVSTPASAPQTVGLRILAFPTPRGRSAAPPQLLAFEGWSAATGSQLRTRAARESAVPAMQRAIDVFGKPPSEDAALAAHARLVKANLLRFFRIDLVAARDEALRAAQAFASLPTPDPDRAARARLVEASALVGLAADPASRAPTAPEAAALARTRLEALLAAGAPLAEIDRARAMSLLGYLDLRAGKFDEAAKNFEIAARHFGSAGSIAGQEEMRVQQAVLLIERGALPAGARAYAEVAPLVDRLRDPETRVNAQLMFARTLFFIGRIDDAASLQTKALAAARQYELALPEAGALHGLGHVYQIRGDVQQARTYFEEVLRIARGHPGSAEYIWGLSSAGVAARQEGNFARAMALHEEAVGLAPHPVGRVRMLFELGMDHFASGDYPAAITHFRRSLAVELPPQHHAFAEVRRALAETLIQGGLATPAAAAEAHGLLKQSLESANRMGDGLAKIGAHRVLAEYHASQGNMAEAFEEYVRCFEEANRYGHLGVSPVTRVAMLTHEQSALRGYLDVTLRDVFARGASAARPATARERQALRQLEAVRDAAFGGSDTAARVGRSSAEVEVLLAQMARKGMELAALRGRASTDTERARVAQLEVEISDLRTRVDGARATAAQAGAAHQAGAARAWRELRPGTVQISYALGKQRGYVWARSTAGLKVAALKITPAQLEQELLELGSYDGLASPREVETRLAALSETLLPAGLLPADSSMLEIVAEGRLASVPFAGLRSPVDPARKLIETHTITMVTSMFARNAPTRRPSSRPFRLVALASGAGALRSARATDQAPKLQAATAEIRAVASLFESQDKYAKVKLLTGRDGSADALHGLWGGGADVVHFATHALADLRQPLASLLVLPASDADGSPTYLTAGQVQEWRGDADLVFLSACESAMGPVQFARGMPGLQSAFLRAGARSVIATLWPIEDLLARDFSADFYQLYTRGVSAADALRETQRAWLAPRPGAAEDDQLRRRMTALAHGLYQP